MLSLSMASYLLVHAWWEHELKMHGHELQVLPPKPTPNSHQCFVLFHLLCNSRTKHAGFASFYLCLCCIYPLIDISCTLLTWVLASLRLKQMARSGGQTSPELPMYPGDPGIPDPSPDLFFIFRPCLNAYFRNCWYHAREQCLQFL